MAEVTLRIDGVTIGLKLSDDGCGFDPNLVNEWHELVSMCRMCLRAERLGSKLSVTSQPGAGTTVTLNAPLCHR